MRNLRPSVFGLIKMSFPGTEKTRFSENGQKCTSNFEKTQVSLE